jgi:hypothetical protein
LDSFRKPRSPQTTSFGTSTALRRKGMLLGTIEAVDEGDAIAKTAKEIYAMAR